MADKLAKKVGRRSSLKSEITAFREKVGDHSEETLVLFHIPKVGGTAYLDVSNAIAEKGHTMPLLLGHNVSLPKLSQVMPDLKVCVLIRDPLERTISGFNSRWRQGRPRNDTTWRAPEAAAFAIFRDVRSFLDALISESEFDVSATKYALGNIHHLSHGYAFYFKNKRYLGQNKDRIAYVAHVADSVELWKKMGAHYGIPEELVEANFVRAHESPVSTRSVLDEYSESDVEKMRKQLQKEYDVYGVLQSLVNVSSDRTTAAA